MAGANSSLVPTEVPTELPTAAPAEASGLAAVGGKTKELEEFETGADEPTSEALSSDC